MAKRRRRLLVRCYGCGKAFPSGFYFFPVDAVKNYHMHIDINCREGCPYCGIPNGVLSLAEISTRGDSLWPPPMFQLGDQRLRFVLCHEFDHAFRLIGNHQYPEWMQNEIAVFQKNMERSQSLGMFPVMVGGTTARLKTAKIAASLELFGMPHPDRPISSEEDAKFLDGINRRLNDLDNAQDDRQRNKQIFNGGNEFVDFTSMWLSKSTPMESVLASMISSLWTAYEVLAKDLWAAAVSYDPKGLGIRAIQSNAFVDDDLEASLSAIPNEAGASSNKPKPVIQFFERMLAHEMVKPEVAGKFFAGDRKFNFNRFDGIRHAYKSVFGTAGVNLIFDTEESNIVRLLELLRNLILHNGGVADRFFLQKFEKCDPIAWFARPEAEKEVLIDGSMVRNFADAVGLVAMDLLNFVRDWSTKKKDKNVQ